MKYIETYRGIHIYQLSSNDLDELDQLVGSKYSATFCNGTIHDQSLSGIKQQIDNEWGPLITSISSVGLPENQSVPLFVNEWKQYCKKHFK